MTFLKDKLTFCFDFVRRERLYFFAFLLALCVIAISQPSDTFVDSEPSQALNQLQQSSEELEKSLHDITGWIELLENNPSAVIACASMMSLFSGFFLLGCLFLILYPLLPGIQSWLKPESLYVKDVHWEPEVFFRVLTLIFSLTVMLGFGMGNLWNETAENQNLLGLLSTLATDVLACVSIYAVLRSGGMTFAYHRLDSLRSAFNEVLRGISVYAGVFPIFVAVLLMTMGVSQWLHYEPPVHPLVEIFIEEEGRSAFVFQLALILAAIAAPIFEEIFFRGFCYRLFKSWWGVRAAAGISAALFAGLHGSGFAFFPIFILGLALAWLYEKRGNLTACWTFHILHNILFTGYFFAMKALLTRH